MLIYQYSQYSCEKKPSFLNALSLENSKKEVIAFVGGGGKSSVIEQMAKEFAELGKRTIITTTTHIYKPASNVVLTEDLATVKCELEKNCPITVGIPCGDQKLSSVSDDFLHQLLSICDVLLIEADGSKHLPIKAPAGNEPVIPSFVTLVIGIVGLDCLGKPIIEVSHRPEILSTLLGKHPSETLIPEDIVYVLESESGQKKNVTCRYEMILNKADNTTLYNEALKIGSFLSAKQCLISSLVSDHL